MLAAMRLASREQPLCKRLRKWQISALRRSAKLLCLISNIPLALQSCETLPEGWPCLSTDSAQIGAVKVSSHCWPVSSTTWVERSPISGCLQSSGASLTMSTAGTYCANTCWCSGKYCLQIKRPLSSRQSKMSGTRFARSQKIRAILRGLGGATACRVWEKRATVAHRGRVNPNCRCEAIWREPLLSQPFGKRPPQPHTCYARTPGENS